jgi:hypothetical protein
MYTVIQRRKFDPARQQETRERGEREFFPILQRAPGLVGFYLVNDEEQSTTVGILVWQDKQSADAFQAQAAGWMRTLEELGNKLESSNRGETVVEITPQR